MVFELIDERARRAAVEAGDHVDSAILAFGAGVHVDFIDEIDNVEEPSLCDASDSRAREKLGCRA